MGLLVGVFGGSTTYVLPDWSPEAFLDSVEKDRITATFPRPATLTVVLAPPGVGDRDLSGLTSTRAAGAPVLPSGGSRAGSCCSWGVWRRRPGSQTGRGCWCRAVAAAHGRGRADAVRENRAEALEPVFQSTVLQQGAVHRRNQMKTRRSAMRLLRMRRMLQTPALR